ncbi:MAG: 50S ribosomal protein L24e [Thermoplasmataceae archaeon]
MAVRKCHFCGKEIEPGSGSLYIKKDGSLMNLCSRKCRVNALTLRRVARKVRWTNEFHNTKNLKKKAQKH